jgi:DNA-binding ferritin-like protein
MDKIMDINVEPTAEAIDTMAERVQRYSDELTSIAKRMREKKDISYAAEATNAAVNMLQNLRLDLLVSRPIREYERAAACKAHKEGK